MSCLVPWSDLINHENVDCTYDFYIKGESIPEDVEIEAKFEEEQISEELRQIRMKRAEEK